MAWHPNTRCSDDIILVLELGWELVDSVAKEEAVVIAVEAALLDRVKEVGRDIQGMKLPEAFSLHGLTDDTRARTNVKANSVAIETKTALLARLSRLIDDMVRLREVNGASPLVVSFGSETSVPLGHVLLLWNVRIELIDDESAFVGVG